MKNKIKDALITGAVYVIGIGIIGRFLLKHIIIRLTFLIFSAPMFSLIGTLVGIIFLIESILIKLIATIHFTFKYPVQTFFNISKN